MISSNVVPSIPNYSNRGWKSLYNEIKSQHDVALVNAIRHLESLYRKKAQKENNIKFLRRCKKNFFVPKYIQQHTLLEKYGNSKKLNNLKSKTEKALLKIEITTNYQDLHELETQIKTKRTEVRTAVPSLWSWIISLLNNTYNKELILIGKKQDEKYFSLLQNTVNQNISKIKTVQTTSDPLPILIHGDIKNPLTPNEEQLLALGLNFALPYQDVPTQLLRIMVQIEMKMNDMELAVPVSNYVREGVTKIIKHDWKPENSKIVWERWITESIRSLSTNNNLKIGKADKNNCVVIMDKDIYETKMLEMIASGPYQEEDDDPTETYLSKVKNIVDRLEDEGKITEDLTKGLIPKHPKCPAIYGSPKTHKEGVPLRPIVDFRFSPTYNLASFLSGILKKVSDNHPYTVKNLTEFVDKIQDQKLKPGHIKVSFDVKSLFTNHPIQDGLYFVKQRLQNDDNWSKYTHLNIDDILEALNLCVTCTSFTYADKTYHQLDGTAMGSPISPVFAELVLHHMERKIVKNIPFISFYIRYVDDIYSHVNARKCEKVLNELNEFHPSIQFTIEKEKDGQLPFLDVMTYTRDDKSIGHRIFRKDTFTNGYLLYSSHHPMAHKIGVVDTQLVRPIRLSDNRFQDTDIRSAIELLQARGYPLPLINRRLTIVKGKEMIRKQTSSTVLQQQKEENEMIPRVILPFIDDSTYKIAKFLRFALGVEIRYFPGMKLGSLLSNFKERKPNGKVGVYILQCKNCKAFYIGETSKSIDIRQSQHQYDVSRSNPNSPVAEHMSRYGHDIGEMYLIEYAANTYYRKLKEGLFICAAKLIMKNNPDLVLNSSNGYRFDSLWSSRLVGFYVMKLKNILKIPMDS